MKKQFSIALLALAIAQVSQAGVLTEIITIQGPADSPIAGMTLGTAPGIGPVLTQVDTTLPEPIGSGVVSGFPGDLQPSSDLPVNPQAVITMIQQQVMPDPQEGSGFIAPTLTAPTALMGALTDGADLLPVPDSAQFEQAANLVQATLMGAGGDGPSPQDQFLAGIVFADKQLAQGISDGSGLFVDVLTAPAAEGQKLADGTYALQAAQTFATEFKAYNEQFAGDGGSPLDPFYMQQPDVQKQVFDALAEGATQLIDVQTTVIGAVSQGAFSAPEMIRTNIPAAPSTDENGNSGLPFSAPSLEQLPEFTPPSFTGA